MLKIHKGLKKKKKDKKNKHKEDELFNEEELEKYRKEHSKPVSSAAEPDLAQPSNSSGGGGSGDQSDEWQKFKALTAGVDTILQKTQEDLDRIKSTSFFQRKPPPSEVERQKEEERQEAEEQQQQQYAKDHGDGDGDGDGEQQSGADGAVEFAAKSESEAESEEVEVDDTLFDTSYVDAVASGELKLAYIPDSPTEKEDDFDPFDTSYANKFIESNPKKRYLNLGCAVQVLSGRQSVVSAESTSPAVFDDKKSRRRRRRPKPVDLLLTSFDDGADPQSAVPTVVERTPVDSPVKTLLDEDPLLLLAKDVDLAPLAVTPIPAPVLASTPVNPAVPDKKEPKLDLSDFELDEFDVLATASAGILDLRKQPSNESTDDEFAQLAAESLARKSSSALPTPNEPIKSFDATTPSNEFIAVDPLQPIAPPEQEEIDPFDTSIVAKVILPGKQEIKLLERELLSDIAAVKAAPPSRVDDIDDDDFDPRAGESSPVKAIRPQELLIKHKAQVDQIVSPSKKPDFLKIEDVDVEVAKPLTPLAAAAAVKPDEQLDSEYDPFDTSHVCGAPGKLELKLIENELRSKKDDDDDPDDDFDPRKYDGADQTQSAATSLTHSILTKYACNPQPPQPEQVEQVAIDILTGKEEDADAIRNFSTPVEPQKFVIESPSEIAFSDPFDTSIAENIQPGKVELKLLETELISKN